HVLLHRRQLLLAIERGLREQVHADRAGRQQQAERERDHQLDEREPAREGGRASVEAHGIRGEGVAHSWLTVTNCWAFEPRTRCSSHCTVTVTTPPTPTSMR